MMPPKRKTHKERVEANAERDLRIEKLLQKIKTGEITPRGQNGGISKTSVP